MEQLLDILHRALNKYFNTLKATGYIKDDIVYKLIVLSFIDDLLEQPNLDIITEEVYTDLYNAIFCLTGNCIIDYPVKMDYDDFIYYYKKDDKIRVDNDFNSRITEDSNIRF